MSLERLDVLRERNRDLLEQLERQREARERLEGCSRSRKREREDGADEEEEEAGDTAQARTRNRGDRRTARAAHAKPTVTFADQCERAADIQLDVSAPCSTSKHSSGTAEYARPLSDIFKDSDRQRGPASTKSCLINHSNRQSRVTFQSDECEEMSSSDRHRLQPLLGYDWIAGVLDAEDSLIERSDDFFNDLRLFRSLNKDECVHSPQAEFSKETHSMLPPLTDTDGAETNVDAHQCTFSYRMNSRLFPVPLRSEDCCPVCKKQKSSHPHTTAEPALIRVSIPRSTLLPPHKYKAHRRCSFDPSDSLGLPSHCLSGWSNKGQSTLPPPSSLDLRSSLKTSLGSQDQHLEDLLVPKVSGHKISDVSLLARHNFQHFSPKRKLGSAFYPLC